MRGAVVIAGVIVAAAAPARADPDAPPPLIGEAIHDAAELGRPLVVELHATWCGPCQWFRDRVLPRAEVRRALETVELVRYDIDTPEGEAVARRYRATAVPTFLVIDADGVAVERIAGLLGAELDNADADAQVAAWFVDLIASGRRHVGELAEIHAAIAQAPRDPAPRLALARAYRNGGALVQAVGVYRDIVDATPAMLGPAVASAAAELADVLSAERRVADAASAAMTFARSYPGARETPGQLAIAAASGLVSEAEIRTQLAAHLAAAVPGASLAEGIRLALGLHLDDLVTSAMTAWRTAFPDAALLRLVEAEVGLMYGHRHGPRRRFAATCADPPRGLELDCYVLGLSVVETWRGAPGVRRILSTAAAYVAGLEHPGEGASAARGIDDLAVLDRELGNAIAHALRIAGSRCADRAEAPGRVVVSIEAGERDGRPRDVAVRAVREIGEPARRCVEDVVAAAALPGTVTAAGEPLWGRVDLIPAMDHGTRSRRPASLVVAALGRGGALTTAGLGVFGAVGLPPVADFGSELAWEGELGVDDGAATVAAARALVGLSIAAERWQAGARIGLGVSRAGGMPAAAELPFELRVDGEIGPARLHVWARGTWLFGAAGRGRLDESPVFGADEAAIGAAVAARSIYLGAVYETRALGASGLLVVGVPLGRAP